jgi:hypothetical protein
VYTGYLVSSDFAGAVAFTSLHAAGIGADRAGHVFGYAALVVELLAYAGQMVLLPKVSKRYGSLTLTSLYYTVASLATAATLVLREHGDLTQVIHCTFHPVLCKSFHTVASLTFRLHRASILGPLACVKPCVNRWCMY